MTPQKPSFDKLRMTFASLEGQKLLSDRLESRSLKKCPVVNPEFMMSICVKSLTIMRMSISGLAIIPGMAVLPM